MRRWVIASLFLLSACGAYDREAHRLTRSRAEFDTFCAKGMIPWRVFYEGSDSAFHNFIVNDMDSWGEMRIPLRDLVQREALVEIGPDLPDHHTLGITNEKAG